MAVDVPALVAQGCWPIGVRAKGDKEGADTWLRIIGTPPTKAQH